MTPNPAEQPANQAESNEKGLPPPPEAYMELKRLKATRISPEFLYDSNAGPRPEDIRTMAQPYKEYFQQVTTYFQEQRLEGAEKPTRLPIFGHSLADFRAQTAIQFARMMAVKFGIPYGSEVSQFTEGSSFERQEQKLKYIAKEGAGNGKVRLEFSAREENGEYGKPVLHESTMDNWYETRVRDAFLQVMDEF